MNMTAHKAYSGGGVASACIAALFIGAHAMGLITLNEEKIMSALMALGGGIAAIGVGVYGTIYGVSNRPKPERKGP